MSCPITYVPSAVKALRKLDRQVARRLLEAIGELAEDPRPPGCTRLKGGDGELVVLMLRLGHRREVYR